MNKGTGTAKESGGRWCLFSSLYEESWVVKGNLRENETADAKLFSLSNPFGDCVVPSSALRFDGIWRLDCMV